MYRIYYNERGEILELTTKHKTMKSGNFIDTYDYVDIVKCKVDVVTKSLIGNKKPKFLNL